MKLKVKEKLVLKVTYCVIRDDVLWIDLMPIHVGRCANNCPLHSCHHDLYDLVMKEVGT